jgi:GDP-L-fucose synthase
MREEYIAAGPLCPYNRANAIAQAAGIAMCQVYRKQYQFNAVVAVSSMVYGPSGGEDEGRQGFLSEMIDLFVEAVAENAKKVRIVRNPDVRREFLFSADFAEACEFLLRHYDGKEPVNIGSGVDVSIRDLAEMIKDISGFEGAIEYDGRAHDEDFQRLLDVASLHTMGWMARTVLREGLVRLWETSYKKGLLI